MKVLSISFIIFGASLCLPSYASDAKDYREITEEEARRWVEESKEEDGGSMSSGRETVSDRETAIALAVAVWSRIYLKESIERQKPYQVMRVDDCWFVTGSLPKGFLGGTAKAVIRASDGCFLLITHTMIAQQSGSDNVA